MEFRLNWPINFSVDDVLMKENVSLYFAARRQDGDGRHFPHGGHGAILRRAVGRHETIVDRFRSSRVLRPIQ